MLFLLIGITLLTLKLLEIDPVATWSWLIILAPFALAAVWWSWADASGYTKRRQVDKENARKQARIDKNRANIGLGPKKK